MPYLEEAIEPDFTFFPEDDPTLNYHRTVRFRVSREESFIWEWGNAGWSGWLNTKHKKYKRP